MSSESDDHRITRYSSEHYDAVGADLDWSIILAAACPIFFWLPTKHRSKSSVRFYIFLNLLF